MRSVTLETEQIWQSGQFTGSRRPIARATIQRTNIITRMSPAKLHRFSTYLFGNASQVYELPNVKSVSWQRSVEMDAATCTLVLYNTRPLPIGVAPDQPYDPYNRPGFFTFNRGDDPDNPWGHARNMWTRRLVPDMLIKTWEGYGFDPDLGPEEDPHMYASGVWLIDDVELDAAGLITVTCRDAARLLIDQIAFPPVVASGSYPLTYHKRETVAYPKVPVASSSAGTHWVNPTYYDDSGEPYVGRNGSISGHRPSDAFDGSNDTYWLSIGNASPTAPYAYEWIEGKITRATVAAVRCFTKGGPYRMYVSLHDGITNKWIGKATVPYDPNNPASSPNGANIPYVKSVTVAANSDVTVDVTDTPNIDRVRVTFHDLWDSNVGTYQYRAGVRDLDVLVTTSSSATTWVTPTPATHVVGNYDDYTDIVKQLCGYGGFLWPSDPTIAFQTYTSSDHLSNHQVAMAPNGGQVDPVNVGVGAIWGDLENSGTYGKSDLDTSIFDKKPLMDGISYIRDMLGFIFFIDETGGVIFRSPNIWTLGNWKVFANHRTETPGIRTDVFTTIHESQTLMGLKAKLSSRNVRERVLVANLSGNFGAISPGFNPYKLPGTGMRRIAIWSDQHFETAQECQVMADLIAVRQLFTYRTDRITIPGYPAIQIDDQVKLVEAVTEENNDVHYVKGIQSSLDMSTGKWTYELDTHWLGDAPFDRWAFNPGVLAAETKQYLAALGVTS